MRPMISHSKSISALVTFTDDDGEDYDVEVEAEYIPGSPGRWSLDNGDPGHPPDAPEVNITAAIRTDTREEVNLTEEQEETAINKLLEAMDY